MQKAKGREHQKSRYPWLKYVKAFSHRRNRSVTRQLLHHQRYEDIPPRKPAAVEDEWGWN